MTICEKVSYLKGLAEGLNIDKDSKEGKVILAIIDVLDDMAFSVSDLEDGYSELSEYCEDIDKDLGDVEEMIYGDEEDKEDDDDLYTYKCPSCGEEVYLDDDDLEEENVECPYCGEEIELDLDDLECCCEDEECDCHKEDK